MLGYLTDSSMEFVEVLDFSAPHLRKVVIVTVGL